jgi:hypothetical protein
MEKKRKDRLQTQTAKHGLSRSATAPAASAAAGGRLRRYPVDGPLINVHQSHNEFTASSACGAGSGSVSGGGLFRVGYSADGALLGLATADSAVTTLRLPISRYGGEGAFFMGHDAGIDKYVCWVSEAHCRCHLTSPYATSLDPVFRPNPNP